MDFSNVCRTCLGSKYLQPIFQESEQSSDYPSTLLCITGLQVEPDDGLPQQICSECAEFLKKTLQFKNIVKTTQSKLINLKNSHTALRHEIIFTKENVNVEDYLKSELEEDDVPLQYYSSTKDVNKENNTHNMSIQENYDDSKNFNLDKNTHKTLAREKKEAYCMTTNTSTQQSVQKLVNSITNKVYTAAPSKYITCSICNKKLAASRFDKHMSNVHPETDKRKVKCELCNKYLFKEEQVEHIKWHDSNSLKCFHCKNEFLSTKKLAEHIPNCPKKRNPWLRKPNGNRGLVECDVCNKKMQKNSLSSHKKVQHGGMKPVCEHCGVKFANKLRLAEHCRAKHGYEKFKCTQCDFQCSGNVALKNHVRRRHLDEKPFVCEACGAKFHAAYLLSQHRQSHRTERDVKCDLCPSAFKTNNSLHMHKLTCHSTVQFQCYMCARTYPCRHYAVKHIRHAHGYSGPVPQLQRIQM